MKTIKFELKYCERCGTLKLRRTASESTYCHNCVQLLARYAFPRLSSNCETVVLPLPCRVPFVHGGGLSGSVQ